LVEGSVLSGVEGPVLSLVEGVCTLERGIGESMPWTLPLDENWRVVDFE
jgi:hypothetical protein